MGIEECVAVNRFQFPIGAGFEILYLRLPLDNQSECGCLHPSHGQHLPVLAAPACVSNSVRARGVHAQQPVPYSAHQSCFIQMLVFRLVFQRLEALADRLFRQRIDPQSFHRATASRLLIDPPLDQLSLLARITAVDHLVGLVNQRFDYVELFVNTLVTRHFDRETRRDHRQRTEAPGFPLVRIFLRVEQGAQMAEGPGHLVPVPFKIAVFALFGA